MGEDSKTTEDQLNEDFNSLYEWFIDNKLSIHFGEEKTKSILFGLPTTFQIGTLLLV